MQIRLLSRAIYSHLFTRLTLLWPLLQRLDVHGFVGCVGGCGHVYMPTDGVPRQQGTGFMGCSP